MSREDVEFVRRGYDAFNQMLRSRRVDRALIEELYTVDCVLRPAGIREKGEALEAVGLRE